MAQPGETEDIVDWAAIADGDAPSDHEFAMLSARDQVDAITNGLRWASQYQVSAPQRCYNVTTTALHLLDAYAIDDAECRMRCGVLVGISAHALGRHAEARLQFEVVLARPAADFDTDQMRVVALMGLAATVADSEPDRAEQLYVEARRVALGCKDLANAASAAISLGSLQRRTDRCAEARQTYLQSIREMEDIGTPETEDQSVLARLCGNLANLLTDDLGCHGEAIDYYTKAVALFDRAGEPGYAAERSFHRVCAYLADGRHEAAFQAMSDMTPGIDQAPRGFLRLLLETGWLGGGPAVVERWARLLDALADQPVTRADPEVGAALLAARLVTHARIGASIHAIDLARRTELRQVPPSELQRALIGAVGDLASGFSCPGICWHLLWLIAKSDDAVAQPIRCAQLRESAALWLLDWATTIEAAPPVQRQEAERRFTEAAPPCGIGLADDDLPSWVGPVPAAIRQRYRLLRSRYPGGEDTERHLQASEAALRDDGDDDARCADTLRRCIYWADLAGAVTLSVDFRIQLAATNWPPTTQERYRAAMDLLAQAGELAVRLPTREVRVHLTRADVLAQCPFEDRTRRLRDAATEAQRAMDIADNHQLLQFIPAIALAHANALFELPHAGASELAGAALIARRGLAAIDPARADLFLESGLRQTLGGVLFKTADHSDSIECLLEAKTQLTTARAIRQQMGATELELTTLGNLLGVLVRLFQRAGSDSAESDIWAIVQRVLGLRETHSAAPRLGTVMLNTAQALKALGHPAALEVATAAIATLRERGPLEALAAGLINTAAINLDAGNASAARDLALEAIEVGERLRRHGLDSRNRAQVSAAFDDAQLLLDRAMERLGASDADRWRELERGTTRTILDDMSSRARHVTPDHRQLSAALQERLPAGTAVCHIFRTADNHIAAFVITTHPRFDIRLADPRYSLEALARDTGGGVDGRKLRLVRYGPQHGWRFADQLARLGSGFLVPLLRQLSAGVQRIVMVDRVFGTTMPWHAVPTEDGTPLGMRCEVIGVPSTGVLARLLSADDRPLLKGAFVACDPHGTLQSHIFETRQAFHRATIPQKIIVTDVSRPVVKSGVCDLRGDVDLFHYAGHSAMVDGAPELSGLQLSDGILTVAEIEAALQHSAPQLVFLSSCESGRSEHQLLDGPTISSVFLQAGTPTVISAAWPVTDEVAAATAGLFYDALPRSGPLSALRYAQQHVRTLLGGLDGASFGLHGWSPH